MNRNKTHTVDLYALKPQEFERFVADVFLGSGYKDVNLLGGPMDQGVDILASKDGQKVAVQVLHKKQLPLKAIQFFIDKYFQNPLTPRNLIIVTSAELPSGIENQLRRIPDDANLKIIDRHELEIMISGSAASSQNTINEAENRKKSQKQRLIISIVAGLLSIIGSLFSSYSFLSPTQAPLDSRIQTVEKALSSMHDLESYLADIKKDMEETRNATAAINRKYKEAKELEKLTDAQISALQATLKVRSWKRTILDYILGFILGVASSFGATILYDQWKQWKALE